MAAGLDSLGAVELRNALEARLGPAAGPEGGLSLPSTLVFDYPSAAAMAGFITSQLGVREGAAAQAAASGGGASQRDPGKPQRALAATGATATAAPARLVGVVGTACRTPGSAIGGAAGGVAAADAVTPAPLSRWDWDWLAAGAAAAGGTEGAAPPARFGGWLPGIEAFDAAAFGIGAAERELMDAQQRLLLEGALEAAWHCGGGGSGVGGGGASAAGELFPGDACVAVGIARFGRLPINACRDQMRGAWGLLLDGAC
jgi:hypothetical protein